MALGIFEIILLVWPKQKMVDVEPLQFQRLDMNDLLADAYWGTA